MKVLVIGSGGREHALAWKLGQSPKVEKVYVAPGNAGTAQDAENVPISEKDFPELINFCKKNDVTFVVVGPEAPLTAGAVDAFAAAGIRAFGPNKKAAQIEGSKVFCKEVLNRALVPTARAQVFDSAADAYEFIDGGRETGYVIKADGLAAGKGVVVASTKEEAKAGIKTIAEDRAFGDAGARFLIEERLVGQEASVLAITDGQTIMTLQPAQDHKAAYDGDKGPNTGGMGAYCPASLVDDQKLAWIEEKVLLPTVITLNRLDTPFKGVLYAGLMMTPQGPKVLEYNARFGDPECQPLLFRLKTDLLEVMEATVDEKLVHMSPLEWDERPAVCVVMASKGYPGSYEKGKVISGLDEAAKLPDVKVFHAGTKLNDAGQVVTNGGRVLDVVALGETVADAKRKAYEAVAKISWDGAWCRSDVADKEIKASQNK
ncbi:MAG: phosphoribosylamine--glycine ligase [Thermoguttaceae bacterium]|nr:phosphoribosylamine--glycine ligase [Thermoguttaceae bacterium]MBQ2038842.1 phosphoribosylamine--glycine ligase [Thermoguttaceae bacterium]MBQ2556731.1 phosphoribosylamine--glycine ligase [Thermoguttaceae bacterium]MBQ3822691.1 phosphoribosylamine--glycine ligase [Thermoguttaceae bacterium]MBQ4204864.1 phosphoribosylamine--glycine ligase [Thermoguttaceae bacterium]